MVTSLTYVVKLYAITRILVALFLGIVHEVTSMTHNKFNLEIDLLDSQDRQVLRCINPNKITQNSKSPVHCGTL